VALLKLLKFTTAENCVLPGSLSIILHPQRPHKPKPWISNHLSTAAGRKGPGSWAL